MWRPTKWKESLPETTENLGKLGNQASPNDIFQAGVEAGADSILQALSEQAVYIDMEAHKCGDWQFTGQAVTTAICNIPFGETPDLDTGQYYLVAIPAKWKRW